MKKPKKSFNLRVGYGFDLHRLIEGRKLIIGGVEIPSKKGMLGHSDGDVVIHAICDAILGSIGEGEIGVYFPPTDLTIMGISSRMIAEKTLEILKSKNGEINQIDIVIIAEEPKIKPYYDDIKKSIAEIFKITQTDVNLKAKTMEGLGDIGKGEGIICHAVVTVKIYC
ncbi:MAG: 2-C-methyl-D-erythritol 2,4-cyclodiphosphate synthase [Elusimicrobiales bacterium]